MQKSRCALTWQPIENRPTFNTCNSSLAHITCTANWSDQHSSSSCKGTSGLLHIMGSNTMIFCCFNGVTYMSLLHCVINWTIFPALHVMQTRYCDENSVCPSVCPFVTRVCCDKTVERSVQIYIPYERTFSLVFWEEEWLVGGDPFYVKFWVNRPPLERNRRFSTNNRS